MPRMPGDPQAEFWEHVREALRRYLDRAKNTSQTGTAITTQAELARALGLKPQTLSNFLSARKTNKSLGGLAIANACALGIEFECNRQRIGLLRGQKEQQGPATSDEQQLVLEFTGEFHLIRASEPLSIELRKGLGAATQSARQPSIKIKMA